MLSFARCAALAMISKASEEKEKRSRYIYRKTRASSMNKRFVSTVEIDNSSSPLPKSMNLVSGLSTSASEKRPFLNQVL